MKTLVKYIKARHLILIFCLAYFLLRTISLDQLYLSRDERDLAMTSYSIAKSGRDLFGHKLPLKFERISPNVPVVPVYYGVLWWLMPIEKNVFNARLAYLFPASLLPLLVFELVYLVAKKKDLAAVSSLVFALSPWIFHISRMALEINLALPFVLLAVLFQLRRRFGLSFLFYILTFFSYQGFRPMVIILPIYFEIYSWFVEKGSIKKLIYRIGAIMLFFLAVVALTFKFESGIKSRSANEILFLNQSKLAQETIFMDRISTASPWLKSVYNNKAVLVAGYLTENLYKGLDLSYLFVSGDYDPQYANGVAGQFVSILTPFLFLGVLFLKRKPIGYFFMTGLAIVGLLPSLVNVYSVTFSIRSALSAVGLSFLIAVGLTESYQFIKEKKWPVKNIIIMTVGFFLLLQTSAFFYSYFSVRFGLYSELYSENDRQLSRYLAASKKRYLIVSPLPYQTLMNFVFMSPTGKQDLFALSKMISGKYDNFKYKGNTFRSCERMGLFLPEQARKTIISEACVSGEKKPLIENKIKPPIIYYSSHTPFNYQKISAYYIFD